MGRASLCYRPAALLGTEEDGVEEDDDDSRFAVDDDDSDVQDDVEEAKTEEKKDERSSLRPRRRIDSTVEIATLEDWKKVGGRGFRGGTGRE